jgi:hypothetical protein
MKDGVVGWAQRAEVIPAPSYVYPACHPLVRELEMNEGRNTRDSRVTRVGRPEFSTLLRRRARSGSGCLVGRQACCEEEAETNGYAQAAVALHRATLPRNAVRQVVSHSCLSAEHSRSAAAAVPAEGRAGGGASMLARAAPGGAVSCDALFDGRPGGALLRGRSDIAHGEKAVSDEAGNAVAKLGCGYHQGHAVR